jgi:hypothetical protein
MASCTSWTSVIALTVTVALTPCSDDPQRAPAGFSPARALVRQQGRIARCNTVHSLTLPADVMHHYGLRADEDTGVISCTLQLSNYGTCP